MILVLNNLCKEYDVNFDGLENHITSRDPNALTAEMIHENLNHWYEKIENKNGEKTN